MIVVLDVEESPCFFEALEVIEENYQDVYTQRPSFKQLKDWIQQLKNLLETLMR